jgi:hypothetical protein
MIRIARFLELLLENMLRQSPENAAPNLSRGRKDSRCNWEGQKEPGPFLGVRQVLSLTLLFGA